MNTLIQFVPSEFRSIVNNLMDSRPILTYDVEGDTVVGTIENDDGDSMQAFLYSAPHVSNGFDISDLYGVMHDVFNIPPDIFNIIERENG